MISDYSLKHITQGERSHAPIRLPPNVHPKYISHMHQSDYSLHSLRLHTTLSLPTKVEGIIEKRSQLVHGKHGCTILNTVVVGTLATAPSCSYCHH